MLEQLRFAAVALIAGAIIALTIAPVWAFSLQTVQPNGNYDFNYGPLDQKKLDDSTNKSDPNSPGFHFSIESVQPGQTGPFGFQGFGGSSNSSPPEYYRPGNGN
jgi:hypothetical protein